MTREEFFKCIDDEPELPGDLPDEVWDRIESAVADGDRDFFVELVRIAVRLTKSGIKNRFIHRKKFSRVQRR